MQPCNIRIENLSASPLRDAIDPIVRKLRKHEGRWLQSYEHRTRFGDPPALTTTEHRHEAMEFPDTAQAMGCWKRAFGSRPDGRPNRPLTAFTIQIVPTNEEA